MPLASLPGGRAQSASFFCIRAGGCPWRSFPASRLGRPLPGGWHTCAPWLAKVRSPAGRGVPAGWCSFARRAAHLCHQGGAPLPPPTLHEAPAGDLPPRGRTQGTAAATPQKRRRGRPRRQEAWQPPVSLRGLSRRLRRVPSRRSRVRDTPGRRQLLTSQPSALAPSTAASASFSSDMRSLALPR